MSNYKAKAPLVIGKDETDRDVYFYAGQPVPENVTEKSRKRLLKEGFIEKVEAEKVEAEKSEDDAGTVPAK